MQGLCSICEQESRIQSVCSVLKLLLLCCERGTHQLSHTSQSHASTKKRVIITQLHHILPVYQCKCRKTQFRFVIVKLVSSKARSNPAKNLIRDATRRQILEPLHWQEMDSVTEGRILHIFCFKTVHVHEEKRLHKSSNTLFLRVHSVLVIAMSEFAF